MAARKPRPLRWSEEAEASHVSEWATLEHGSPTAAAPLYICSARPVGPLDPFGVLSRVRLFLRRAHLQIMRDGQQRRVYHHL
jgi:hypothetical protein